MVMRLCLKVSPQFWRLDPWKQHHGDVQRQVMGYGKSVLWKKCLSSICSARQSIHLITTQNKINLSLSCTVLPNTVKISENYSLLSSKSADRRMYRFILTYLTKISVCIITALKLNLGKLA